MPPVIKEGSALVTSQLSQDALLPCEVEGDGLTTVTWRKDGFRVSPDDKKYVRARARTQTRLHAREYQYSKTVYCVFLSGTQYQRDPCSSMRWS